MGFGIPDEVMERIRDTMWGGCGSGVYPYDPDVPYIAVHRTVRIKPEAPKFYYPSVSAKVTPAYTSLTSQDIFFASAYYAVVGAIQEDKLRSEIIADWVSCRAEYYLKLFPILMLDPQKVASVGKTKYDKSAGDFLIRSIFDGMLHLFDSPTFSKPNFRDAVDDIFYLATSWKIVPSGTKNRSDYFFTYVKDTYGLKQSNFFCCPFCGEPLINGIAFCPNCFENSRDSVTPRYRPAKPAVEEVLPSESEEHLESITAQRLKAAEEEKWELTKQLDTLMAAIAEKELSSAETIKQLEDIIKKLRQDIAERDKQIASLYRQKNGLELPSNVSEKKRILVFGASTLATEEMLALAENVGLANVDFEFQTDYGKLKKVAARIKKNSSAYVGIIVGPAPHKVKEDAGAKSPSAYFKRSGFYVVEAKIYNGQLKITRESVRSAFSAMYNHLLATGFYTT